MRYLDWTLAVTKGLALQKAHFALAAFIKFRGRQALPANLAVCRGGKRRQPASRAAPMAARSVRHRAASFSPVAGSDRQSAKDAEAALYLACHFAA